MRRASTLPSLALYRSLLQQRVPQVALYGTTTSSSAQRRWFSGFVSGRSASIGLAGALITVAGATSLFQEVYAKERPTPELVPKEVILYQYEACPFCNKVKGELI